jgi:hypothetical protein
MENRYIMPTAWSNIPKSNISKYNIPKIAVCIPYNSNWFPEWTDKTYCPLKYVPTNWCTKITFLSKVQSLPVARDILVNQALQSNCDYIFFLDTDMVFESPNDPNVALNHLYQVINKDPSTKDGKIVGALYRAKQKVGFSFSMWTRAPNNIRGYTPIESWTGNWINVSVTGLGCALIDMEVFKNIERPWFRWEMNEEISEDFSFFELAKSRGFDTHVFTDVKLSHLGGLKVKSDGTIVTPDM